MLYTMGKLIVEYKNSLKKFRITKNFKDMLNKYLKAFETMLRSRRGGKL